MNKKFVKLTAASLAALSLSAAVLNNVYAGQLSPNLQQTFTSTSHTNADLTAAGVEGENLVKTTIDEVADQKEVVESTKADFGTAKKDLEDKTAFYNEKKAELDAANAELAAAKKADETAKAELKAIKAEYEAAKKANDDALQAVKDAEAAKVTAARDAVPALTQAVAVAQEAVNKDDGADAQITAKYESDLLAAQKAEQAAKDAVNAALAAEEKAVDAATLTHKNTLNKIEFEYNTNDTYGQSALIVAAQDKADKAASDLTEKTEAKNTAATNEATALTAKNTAEVTYKGKEAKYAAANNKFVVLNNELKIAIAKVQEINRALGQKAGAGLEFLNTNYADLLKLIGVDPAKVIDKDLVAELQKQNEEIKKGQSEAAAPSKDGGKATTGTSKPAANNVKATSTAKGSKTLPKTSAAK